MSRFSLLVSLRALVAAAFFALLSILPAQPALAQPQAPLFDCVRGDTLFWVEPVDPCGPLGSIDVFGSATASGTFSLLANVIAGTGPYYALPPAQALINRYFYVVARYPSCTPEASAPTPTINNEALEVPRIQSIDYTNTGTRLEWNRPADTRVTRFLVYRETAIGITLLDTVDGTSYFDAGTQVELAPAIYYLGSLNDCNSSSFSSSAFSSATVIADRDICAGKLSFTRKLGMEWPVAFTRAALIRSRVGGPTDTIEISGADSSLVIDDIAPDTAYTLKVIYYDREGGFTAAFPIDLSAESFVAEDLIEIAQVSYETQGWILRWRWEPRAEYTGTEYIVRQGGKEVLRELSDPDFNVLPAPVVDLDLPADFDWTGAEVLVRATDACGVLRESVPARPASVFAQEVNPFLVATNWTLPQAGNIINAEWTLRFTDGTVGARSIFTSDMLQVFGHDVTAINFREVCYELVTEVRLQPVLRRGEARFLWRSAPSCVLRQPRVYLATGFVPEGFTIEYRPKMSLIEGLTYRLDIFDRWGRRQFTTDNPFIGWSGTNDTNAGAPTGTYLAVVTLEEPGRSPIRIEQAFSVVR